MVFRVLDGAYVAHRDGLLHITDFHSFDLNAKINLGDRFFAPKDLSEKAILRRIQHLTSGKIVDLR